MPVNIGNMFVMLKAPTPICSENEYYSYLIRQLQRGVPTITTTTCLKKFSSVRR